MAKSPSRSERLSLMLQSDLIISCILVIVISLIYVCLEEMGEERNEKEWRGEKMENERIRKYVSILFLVWLLFPCSFYNQLFFPYSVLFSPFPLLSFHYIFSNQICQLISFGYWIWWRLLSSFWQNRISGERQWWGSICCWWCRMNF